MLSAVIIDDSNIMRKSLTKELSNLGIKVYGTGENEAEALNLYKIHNPDFVTMDFTLNSDKNGIDISKSIIKEYKEAKIIMITSNGEQLKVIEAIKSGAKGYVLKPVKAEHLREAILKIFPDEKFIK